MKKFLALILCLCFVACGLIFVGCGNETEIVLNGGPAYEDKIYGNGGMVVTKGDYVYFTDSYIKSSSIESSTTIDVNKISPVGTIPMIAVNIPVKSSRLFINEWKSLK